MMCVCSKMHESFRPVYRNNHHNAAVICGTIYAGSVVCGVGPATMTRHVTVDLHARCAAQIMRFLLKNARREKALVIMAGIEFGVERRGFAGAVHWQDARCRGDGCSLCAGPTAWADGRTRGSGGEEKSHFNFNCRCRPKREGNEKKQVSPLCPESRSGQKQERAL